MAVLKYLFASVLCLVYLHLAVADPIVVQSEKLRNFQECSPDQQVQINKAWYEAMSMAADVKSDLNFEHYGAVDFFGPSKDTAGAQNNIRSTCSFTTFQLGSF